MMLPELMEQKLREFISFTDEGPLLGYSRPSCSERFVLREPAPRHGDVQAELTMCLRSYVKAHDLGHALTEVDFYIGPVTETMRRPDVSFFAKGRLSEPLPDRVVAVVPDLAVEVLSVNDRLANVLEKVREYFDCGVRMVWVLHPRRRMGAVFRPGQEPRFLNAHEAFDGEEIVPGFRCMVESVLPRQQ